jgi:hypothetical protein
MAGTLQKRNQKVARFIDLRNPLVAYQFAVVQDAGHRGIGLEELRHEIGVRIHTCVQYAGDADELPVHNVVDHMPASGI